MRFKKVLAAAAMAGTVALAGCAAQAEAVGESVEPTASQPVGNCTGGFEGPWNSTPVDGDVAGLPQETVTVVSETGQIFDAMRRDPDGTAQAVPFDELDDIDYQVKVDPSWPKNHAVAIDTATGEVLGMFEIPADAPLCEWVLKPSAT
ncbi:hypothetical protein GCM10023081_18560 [Arthrobacter ginkgonis]|uniref:Lipoprotein n=1 Tax=Arthrobacter ginkgonis TaxID=1630594 RepID=A0ABP7C7A4_9MICC